MSNSDSQVCTRCVMDTTDPDINFDESGVCSYCQMYEQKWKPVLEYAESDAARRALEALVSRIKEKQKNANYDCIVGLSGGVDSSYVALQVKKLGLRALAVHFDSGWNSELAVNNIENIVKTLGFDLYTVVVDWEEMKNMQLAFFRASLANCDIPQDHAFLAALYGIAVQQKVPFIMSGANASTESILPKAWGYNAADLRHIKAVNRRFGGLRLKDYPTISFFKRYFYYPFIRRIKFINILNMMPYRKEDAKRTISKELKWRDYGGKHYESQFTRFFQSYYLPVKFGYDKRKAHFSSLIVSGQMSREEALRELKRLPYDPLEAQREKEYVAKKMGASVEEFDQIMAESPKTHRDYPSNEWLFKLKDALLQALR